MQSIFRPILFAFHSNRGRFIALLIIALLALSLVLLTDESHWWNELLDPVIGLGTFFFAIAVWYGELLQDWEQKLPKRLTVRFMRDDRLCMICKNAVLVSEADIRQWGQQIGKQMNENSNLSFETFFEIENGKPQKKNLEYYKPYYLSYFLSELPDNISDIKERFQNREYLHWEQLHDSNKLTEWREHPDRLPPIHKNETL